MNITILEDDNTIAFILKKYFEDKGSSVTIHNNLSDALNAPIKTGFHLIDISLPDGEGYTYGKHVSKSLNNYVLYLTAKDSQQSIIKGFDNGADDYLVKPFTLLELDKRMQAIIKRQPNQVITLGDLKIDNDLALVTFKDEEVFLSVQEYRILLLLVKNTDQIVSREEISKLLNILDYTQENTLNVAMARLRKKLEGMITIETVIKQGYKVTL